MEQKITTIPQERNKEAVSEVIDTSNLENSFQNCKLIHLSILRIVYSLVQPPITFKELYKNVKAFASQRTLRDKVANLKKWGLIESIDSGVLLVFPIKDIEKEKRIKQLLNGQKARMGDYLA